MMIDDNAEDDKNEYKHKDNGTQQSVFLGWKFLMTYRSFHMFMSMNNSWKRQMKRSLYAQIDAI